MDFRRLRSWSRKLGRRGENAAAALLKSEGFSILTRNCRIGTAGELDIVARDGGVLVFADVKTLRRSREYRPADNLSPKQLARDLRAAAAYRDMFASAMFPWRFELVEVVRKNMFSISVRRTVLRHS